LNFLHHFYEQFIKPTIIKQNPEKFIVPPGFPQFLWKTKEEADIPIKQKWLPMGSHFHGN